ncbi:hypothetical protein QQX98_010516 [Neonectria punicea]|uniref:Uncharacterized protein n=1 Tax=Neonectria punicea TaxID=979145 RepID=A0ABR1GPU0_9HYPO
MGILSQGVRKIPSPGYSDLLTLSQPDHSQRTFNDIFLESLKDDSSKRIRWTESDNIAQKQWLAKHSMSLAGLRQDEDLLRQLGRSVGIDFSVISTEHWDVVRRKLLASLENKLKKFKKLGLAEYYCQDEKRVKTRWPDAVRDEWASPTWRGEESSLQKAMAKQRGQMEEITSGIETSHLTDGEPINPDEARASPTPTTTIPGIQPQERSSTRSDRSIDRPFNRLGLMDVSLLDDDPRPRSQQALKIRLPQSEQTFQYDREESDRKEPDRKEPDRIESISIVSDSPEAYYFDFDSCSVQIQHDQSWAKCQKRAAPVMPSSWLPSPVATPRPTTAKETTSTLAVAHDAIVSRPKPLPRAVATRSRQPPPAPLAPMVHSPEMPSPEMPSPEMPSPEMPSPEMPSPMALSTSSTKSGQHNLDHSSDNESEDTTKLPPPTYHLPTRRLSSRNVSQHHPRTTTPEAISQQDSPQSACSPTKRDQPPRLSASLWAASKPLPTPETWRLPTPAKRQPGSWFAPRTSGRVESSNASAAPASSSSWPIPAVVASNAHHHLGTESRTQSFSSPVLPSVERPRQPAITCEAKPPRFESTSRNKPSPQSSDINTTQPVGPGARSISQHSLQSTPAESQTQRLTMQMVQEFEAAAETRAMKLRQLVELSTQQRALMLEARHVVALDGEGGFRQEAFWLEHEVIKEEAKQLLDEIRRDEASYDLGSLTLTVPGGCFERLVLSGCF